MISPQLTYKEVIKTNLQGGGSFYYFTELGAKLRKHRWFNSDATKDCNDEVPLMSKCSKLYKHRKAGFTYLFAFFCPCHGHCYGVHTL